MHKHRVATHRNVAARHPEISLQSAHSPLEARKGQYNGKAALYLPIRLASKIVGLELQPLPIPKKRIQMIRQPPTILCCDTDEAI
ncbi:hypothetical protein KW459_16100 [Vibrio fluvialis]|nr:hypothetical protein [Vibrio fluvialis]